MSAQNRSRSSPPPILHSLDRNGHAAVMHWADGYQAARAAAEARSNAICATSAVSYLPVSPLAVCLTFGLSKRGPYLSISSALTERLNEYSLWVGLKVTSTAFA